MIIHPQRGLVIPVGVARSPYLDMYSSSDEGETWTHERIELAGRIHPLEPTAFYHDGHLIFLSRNHILPLRGHGQLKEELYAGKAEQWRFEGALLRLASGMLNIEPDDVDAAHPGGAVMDEENGVQHIFVYCGKYATPSGIFRISRTMETNKLREAVAEHAVSAGLHETFCVLIPFQCNRLWHMRYTDA